MGINHWIQSGVAVLVLSFSYQAAAHAYQSSVTLPQCGGFVGVDFQGQRVFLKFRDVRNCSIVSVGMRSFKMIKSHGTYSFDYEISRAQRPGDILVHSNSKKTMDRVPLYDQMGNSNTGMVNQPAPIYQPTPAGIETKLDLMNVCQSSFDGSDNESKCLQTSVSRGLDAQIIKACEAHFDGDDNELRCLDVATRADVISSCEQAFDGDENELNCLSLARSPEVVQACEQAFDGDDNELECLRSSGRGHPETTVRVIRQCESQKDGDTEELKCIQMLLSL